MSVRNLLPIVLLLAALSAGCAGSPTQAEGTVTITETTTTTTTTVPTTTVIPPLIAGAIGTSPPGTGLAWATVYTFVFVTAPSGGVPPYTYLWDFGDGSANGSGNAPTHMYENTGVFTARVTVSDSNGKSATTSTAVAIRNVTGRWIATFAGSSLKPEPIDIVQNQTAVTATINDEANLLGFASGTGNVSNPRALSISATFAGIAPFAVTYVGRIDDTLSTWSGTVTGYAGCPCTFTAVRPSAAGDHLGGGIPLPPGRR